MKKIVSLEISEISKQVAFNMWESSSDDSKFATSPIKDALDSWYLICAGREEYLFRRIRRKFSTTYCTNIIPLRLEGNPPFFVFKHKEKGLQILFTAGGYSPSERVAVITRLIEITSSKFNFLSDIFFKNKDRTGYEWWKFTSSVGIRTQAIEVGGVDASVAT